MRAGPLSQFERTLGHLQQTLPLVAHTIGILFMTKTSKIKYRDPDRRS
jgi:hypothetical protein